MSNPIRIFVTGLTSGQLGGMEHHNLGNFIIAEPLFRHLRETFPEADIVTSIQMSEGFYRKYNINGVRGRRFWTYGVRTGIATAMDILRLLLWKITRLKFFLSSPLLKELRRADLVVDFSGDVYGDNASWNKFLEGNARLALSLALGKQTAMIAGSPGPFTSLWRLWIAKLILLRLDLVTNREPLSTAMLAYTGIQGPDIHSSACPSVLFEDGGRSVIEGAVDFPRIVRRGAKDPIWGVIVSGWNMPVGPYDRWPRSDWELMPFVELIEYIAEQTSYRICLMSHQNATTDDGNLIRGNDHRIIDRIVQLVGELSGDADIFQLEGLYNASESRSIIGEFDILMSGRVHGAVQGLSQCIPTGIIDYGHEPKAHKLRGFARVYGIDEYVCDPGDGPDMIEVADQLRGNRENLERFLEQRVEGVKAEAMKNFKMLQGLVYAE